MEFPRVGSDFARGSNGPRTSPVRHAATDGLAPHPPFSEAVSITGSAQLARQGARSRFLLQTSVDQDGGPPPRMPRGVTSSPALGTARTDSSRSSSTDSSSDISNRASGIRFKASCRSAVAGESQRVIRQLPHDFLQDAPVDDHWPETQGLLLKMPCPRQSPRDADAYEAPFISHVRDVLRCSAPFAAAGRSPASKAT